MSQRAIDGGYRGRDGEGMVPLAPLPAVREAARSRQQGAALSFKFVCLLSFVNLVGLAAATTPSHSQSRPEATMDSSPVLLMIQGRLKPGAEAIYQKYIAGTGPLMAKYGAKVESVGGGIESKYTTATWPVNAVLSFPDLAAAEGFLSDPDYLEIKEKYRDQAYQTLNLSFLQSRPAVTADPNPLMVAKAAFDQLSHGLATGEWQPWLDSLAPEFTFRFPAGKYQGVNVGKAKAEEFFPYVSSVYPTGLFVEDIERVTDHGNTVVFEFKDRGIMRGQPYQNHVAISLDVEGDKIIGYREYFGIVGPPPEQQP